MHGRRGDDFSENFKAWVPEEILDDAVSLADEVAKWLAEKHRPVGTGGVALLLVAGGLFRDAPVPDKYMDGLALEAFRTGREAVRAAKGGPPGTNSGGEPTGSA